MSGILSHLFLRLTAAFAALRFWLDLAPGPRCLRIERLPWLQRASPSVTLDESGRERRDRFRDRQPIFAAGRVLRFHGVTLPRPLHLPLRAGAQRSEAKCRTFS